MRKSHVIGALAKKYRLRRYLEINTPINETAFGDVERSLFKRCDRLMYRVPPGFDDGLAVTYPTEQGTAAALYDAIAGKAGPAPYDIIFIDSFHTYRSTALDILGAFRLLAERGIVIVHDCDPRDPTIMNPDFTPGEWCGATYAAFIDFVLSHPALPYCTVDTDYGCGVIYRNCGNPRLRPSAAAAATGVRHAREWCAAADHPARLAVYQARRRSLLNVVSPEAFVAAERLSMRPCDSAANRPLPYRLARGVARRALQAIRSSA